MTGCCCRAVAAGITVMSEVGVDPGIDHLLAMECFDTVAQKGGKVSTPFVVVRPYASLTIRPVF